MYTVGQSVMTDYKIDRDFGLILNAGATVDFDCWTAVEMSRDWSTLPVLIDKTITNT